LSLTKSESSEGRPPFLLSVKFINTSVFIDFITKLRVSPSSGDDGNQSNSRFLSFLYDKHRS
jgi:hypothetical protein